DPGGAHGLLEATDARLPTRVLRLNSAQLSRDVARGRAERGHPVRIEVDANLAVDAADARDPAHARHAAQLARHDEIDEPRELRVAHRVRSAAGLQRAYRLAHDDRRRRARDL